MAKSLDNQSFFEFIASPGIRVIDFYAEWCLPCKNFIRIWDRVETGLAEVNASIAKVDTDKYTDIKEAYDVHSVPAFLYFKNGIEVSRHTGIKTIGQMKEIILNLDLETI